jgi:hypothetical protein
MNVLIAFVLSFLVVVPAMGTNIAWTTSVQRILIESVNFGGCMALVSPGPETTGLSCNGGWVSFSCTGEFNSVEVGNRKLTAAQLGLVTGGSISIEADDTKKHNGYCFVQRIDNIVSP